MVGTINEAEAIQGNMDTILGEFKKSRGRRQRWVTLEVTGRYTNKEIEDFFLPEFFDIIGPAVLGAKKHDKNNYLKVDGNTMSHKDNFASIGRHVAEASVGFKEVHDSPIDPRLCAAWRLMASYLRDMREIKHPKDGNNG